jgi:hypothetical protein
MSLVLLILLILLILGGFPGVGPIPHNYGYYPSGIGTVLLIVLIILLATGRLGP